jgi:conjugal transfer pilus assembly protein TraD
VGSFSDQIFKRPRPERTSGTILALQCAAVAAAGWTASGEAFWWAAAAAAAIPAPHLKALLELRARRWLDRPETVTEDDLMDFVSSNPGKCWLGRGFEFTPDCSRRLLELMGSGLRGSQGRGHGSQDIHAISPHNRMPIAVNVRDLRSHTLIFGTTGAGKTRLFDLLISQAVMRGDCVIVLDPKGDRDLRERIASAAEACGRSGDLFTVDLADPSGGCGWDLLGSWTRPSEIGDRLSSLLPSSGGASSFKAYANTAITVAVTALQMAGRKPDLPAIRDALGDLSVAQDVARKKVEELKRDIAAPDADAYYERINDEKKGPSPLALRKFFDYLVESGYASPDPDLELLFTVSGLDRGYYQKISAGALPLLNTLCQKAFRPLFCREKGRMGFGRIIRQGGIFCASLRSLIDSSSGGSVGKLMLADLASAAGYSYASSGEAPRSVSVFIDEAAELACESMVQLLNKSRGAGFSVTAATQTLADLESRGGGRPQAMQIVGNCNTLISMRITDAETAEAVTSSLASTKELQRSLSGSANGGGDEGVSRSASVSGAPLFPPSALTALPDFEYVARLADGRFVKGRIPLVASSKKGGSIAKKDGRL